MNLTEEITKNAILGTDKYLFREYPYLVDFSKKVETHQLDKEDGFLKMAVAAFIFEEAGNDGVEILDNFPLCDNEVLLTANTIWTQHLSSSLVTKDDALFKYVTYLFVKHNLLVSPELVPKILNKALTMKGEADQLLKLCGARGKWLCSLHPLWQVLNRHLDRNETWETGNVAQRKSYFVSMRKHTPEQAVELLSESIHDENAQVRCEFIELLESELSLSDEPFLVGFLNDSSIKVRRIAYELLKKLKGSELNIKFLNFASAVVSVSHERFMLVSKKQIMKWDESVLPDDIILASGVEKVSSLKGVDDFSYILAQVLAYVDPTDLARNCKCTEAELVELFLKHRHKPLLLPYLIKSAIHFHNKEWATILLGLNEVSEIELLDILSRVEQRKFYAKFLNEHFNKLFNFLCNENYLEIESDISKKILHVLSVNPYYITQQQYQLLAFHLPDTVLPFIHQYIDVESDSPQHNFFKKQCLEILRIIEIKSSLTN